MRKLRLITAAFSIALLAACGQMTVTGVDGDDDPCEEEASADDDEVQCFGQLGSDN